MCADIAVRQKKRHKYKAAEAAAAATQEQPTRPHTRHKWQQCGSNDNNINSSRIRRTTAAVKSASASAHKAGIKWKIIISTIILLLCRISHVLAIRKGRLMSPSSFTALSGDLHVQIQFSGEDVANAIDGAVGGSATYDTTITSATTTTTNTTKATTTKTTTTGTTTATTARTTRTQANGWASGGGGDNANASGSGSVSVGGGNRLHSVEKTIMSTLVISKFIDDDATQQPFNDSATHHRSQQSLTADGKVLQRRRKEILQNIPLFPDPRQNITQIAVPCQTFTRGGLYEMQVVTNLKTTTAPLAGHNQTSRTPPPTQTTTTLMPVLDERLRQTLDVRWPSADMQVTPVRLRTYPERAVEVTLRFPEVNCERVWHSAGIDLPEFWLELVYCGKERTCAQLQPQNISRANILYAEQVRGYPKHKLVRLQCDLFGLAGNYAVQLRPMVPAPNVPITRRFLSVDWSDKFVFNVYARSIFPCDPHTGIGVLYEYPACILEQGDRVRVYAKLRADVASLKPPTTLHYVAEQRVVKSQHSLYFSCDLFTEKYVEYCFVYVSQAISGAVADVRMDCVPTLPVSESDTGGWGPWSDWTPCSTNCLGGTRNRYRFCDSPPPRYGAKFCEGPSVETEKCGKSISDTWDCIYESSGATFTKANRTEVNQEVGPGCRCGCIVHLGSSKPKRILAGATQSCPGRSFWLIQVDGDETIALSLNFLRLPCPTQYIKVRDGPSLSSTLLIELNGGSNLNVLPTQIETAGAQLLLEFYAGGVTDGGAGRRSTAADEQPFRPQTANYTATTGASATAAGGGVNAACTGGFLANVEQISAQNASTTLLAAATRLSVKSRAVLPPSKTRSKFTLVHLSAMVFASIIILISALLGAQYMVRYRKYHLAVARRRDEGSRLHTPHASMSSLQSPPSRAMSTTTLLSEVIYLVKMRPKHQLRHSILRESVDAEHLARETEFNDNEAQAHMMKCAEERASNDSLVTLRNEIVSPITESLSGTPSMEELAAVEAEAEATAQNGSCGGTLTRKDSGKDSESIISSGMSSICYSPPTNAKRFSKYSSRYDAPTLKMPNLGAEEPLSSDRDSLRSSRDYERLSQLGSRSVSVSLTNGCYSPAVSAVSTATIRTTNPKESKEKQNRKKLLARPGSEFSLGNQEDLELDYYDYNVINAGAAPGSYLGMDPAHLIWIPPFDDIDDGARDDDDKTPEPEPDETEPLYEEIKMPKYGHYLSARSNTDSSANNTNTANSNSTPSSDELSPLGSHLQSKVTTPNSTDVGDLQLRHCLMQQVLAHGPKGTGKPATPYLTRKQRRQAKQQSKSTLSLGNGVKEAAIPLQPLSGTKSARSIRHTELESLTRHSSPDADAMTGSYVEKETVVEKQMPADLQGFLALDDIQFADESESDHEAMKLKVLGERKANAMSAKNGKNARLGQKRASADSVLLEKRELTNELSGYRVETNV